MGYETRQDLIDTYTEPAVEAYERCLGSGDNYDLLKNFENCYIGQFANDTEFVNNQWPTSGPPTPLHESSAGGWICRMVLDGYVESGGYYFQVI